VGRLRLKGLVLKGLAGIAVILLALALAGLAIWRGVGGSPPQAGDITESRIPPEQVAERDASQGKARWALRPASQKQILFGDLHVHTTFSLDAFAFSLPAWSGEGAHPPADACDFARFCSGLDFWSINDHAENLTPHQWRESVESIRQCNAVAGDPASPDTVAFLGWEWSQAMRNPAEHYGHKNVVLMGLEDDAIPARPIGASRGDLDKLSLMRIFSIFDPLRASAYLDFNHFVESLQDVPECPRGLPVRELPDDCIELTDTPAQLYAKLDDWGFESLVIPHGTAWGLMAPVGANLARQLDQHDPARERLFEVYSGHGSSERWVDYEAVRREADGSVSCPEPRDGFEPCCWRAGEIIRSRCEDPASALCQERVAQARQHFAEARVIDDLKQLFREQVIPGAQPEEWLECGQLPDSFLPAYSYMPDMSAQYGLASSIFAADGTPRRFRWGLMASSDNHTARAGSGYKEFGRRGMADVKRMQNPVPGQGGTDAPSPTSRPVTEVSLAAGQTERDASFFYTGGLVAAHAEGRDRGSIFEALKRREVYGTSGERMLLWFHLVGENGERLPMGSEAEVTRPPRFEVRAAGALEQLPGCPEVVEEQLSAERMARLCKGECNNPGNERRSIARLEIVRIQPQQQPGEPLARLIDDPWLVIPCSDDPSGCIANFEDPTFARRQRETVYYVRAIQEPTPAVNGDTLRCERDGDGRCIRAHPCYAQPDKTDPADDCLAPVEERAWSSPIFVRPASGS